MTDISKLLAEARVILEKAKVAQQESRQRGEQFNIFHACGLNHYETRHSAILAEFLNPEGSHGQGDVYLKAFLDVVPFPFRFDTSTAKVTTEFPTSDGRMDILITNALPKAAFCLAICGLLRRRRRQNGARFAAYEASSAVQAHCVMTTNDAYAAAPGEAPPRPPLHLIYINKD